MKGYRIHAWGGEPVWEDIPDPRPGPEEVLVEVEACGIGLTVLNCIAGNLSDDPGLLPRVPGHELVGRVVEVGEGVGAGWQGLRVAAYFYLYCGDCGFCRKGWQQRCANLAGWVGVHRDGGYAPYAALPSRNVIPLPDGLDPVAATVVPDAVATPVHVTARAGIGPDDRVAVIGAGGGVGIHMVQVALSRGAKVAGLDVTDAKLEAVAEFGATPVRSNDFATLQPGIFEGDRPTVVVDFVGTTESTTWAKDSVDTGGRVVALTTFPGRSVPISPRELVFREFSVIGSRYATTDQLAEAADLVLSGAVRPVIGRVVEPGEVPSVHEDLRAGRLLGRGAIDWRIS